MTKQELIDKYASDMSLLLVESFRLANVVLLQNFATAIKFELIRFTEDLKNLEPQDQK